MSKEDKILFMLEGLVTKVEDLTTKVDGLTTKVDGLETAIAKHDELLEILVSEAGKTRTEISEMKAEISETKDRLTSLEERVILMEESHGKKIDALYDSHDLLYGVSCEINASIAKLLIEQERHGMHIKRLDAERKMSG